ncbi:MAG: polysaccharide biosynthesis/export family protein [Saprospiraceae bacterium]
MNHTSKLLLFLCLILCSSCVQYRDLLSYDAAPGVPTAPQPITNQTAILIQPNDVISVNVSSSSVAAAAPFNSAAGGYQVDADGMIELPTLGLFRVKDLSVSTIKANLKAALRPYFSEEPMVNIRLVNFKINVNGEVGNPGIFQIENGSVTIVDALTLAGDFTPYSRRDSIMIVREFKGERTFGYVDFNSADVFNSPYYFLQQNDMIYVRPRKEKVGTVNDESGVWLRFVSIATGLVAITLSLIRTL